MTCWASLSCSAARLWARVDAMAAEGSQGLAVARPSDNHPADALLSSTRDVPRDETCIESNVAQHAGRGNEEPTEVQPSFADRAVATLSCATVSDRIAYAKEALEARTKPRRQHDRIEAAK